MKVYVDELPSCCEDCVCHNGVSGRCKLLHRTTFDIPPRDCPLQSITDYTKQVRKEVCEVIAKKMGEKLVRMQPDGEFGTRLAIDWYDVNKVLDQIQAEKK